MFNSFRLSPLILIFVSLIIFHKSIISLEIREERIVPSKFYPLLPCIEEVKIDEVIREIDKLIRNKILQLANFISKNQNETMRYQEVDRWLDENWVPFDQCPSSTRKPKVTIDEKDKGKNVNWVRFELKMFVKQRTFARNFIDFLVNATVNLKYFNETEAIRLQNLFWQWDELGTNWLQYSIDHLYKSATRLFNGTHQNSGKYLEILGDSLQKMPDFDKIMNFSVGADKIEIKFYE